VFPSDTVTRGWNGVVTARIGDVHVEAVVGYGLGYQRRIDGALPGEGVQHGHHDMAGVHLEEPA
jgi:hypothetical protein